MKKPKKLLYILLHWKVLHDHFALIESNNRLIQWLQYTMKKNHDGGSSYRGKYSLILSSICLRIFDISNSVPDILLTLVTKVWSWLFNNMSHLYNGLLFKSAISLFSRSQISISFLLASSKKVPKRRRRSHGSKAPSRSAFSSITCDTCCSVVGKWPKQSIVARHWYSTCSALVRYCTHFQV